MSFFFPIARICQRNRNPGHPQMESDASKKTTTGSKVSIPDTISPVQHYTSLSYNSCTILTYRYLHKPYLISGSKFDLRIYVYVTSYDPLRIYIFSDGLVRFASCKSVSPHPHCGTYFCKLYRWYVKEANNQMHVSDLWWFCVSPPQVFVFHEDSE